MKTSLLFLLLFTSFCASAQIVNIPDAAFKSWLLTNQGTDSAGNLINININGDGEIQTAEALAVWGMNISNDDTLEFFNITGLESFINLRTFVTDIVDIHSFSLQNHPNIEIISVSNSRPALGMTVNLANLPMLTTAGLHQSSLNTLTVTNLPMLKSLGGVDTGPLNNFTFSGISNLENLTLYELDQTIDFSQFDHLKSLILWGYSGTTLSFSSTNKLEKVQCLVCPNLTSLDIADKPELAEVILGETNLQSLTFGYLPKLVKLDYDAHQYGDFSTGGISELDLKGCPLLAQLTFYNDENIRINLKNGKATYTSLAMNLGDDYQNYICIDEGEEGAITAMALQNTAMSTYCSFTPGGNYNTITGTTIFDTDNNGCDTGDVFEGLMKVRIQQGTTTGYTFTNSLSQYKFFTQAGNFTLTPQFENNWFTATPATASVNFANNANNTSTNNFCITSSGSHPDVEVVVYPITNAQPGFDATYKIVYKNKGNQTLSGAVSFNYNDAVLDFVSATPAQSSAATGLLTFDYVNLLPFEDRSIEVTLNLNGPMETPPLNNGDNLNFSVAITPSAGDETPTDNLFTYQREIVGSYDPNDITCLEGDIVSPAQIGDYLHYVVNFENTGTTTASFIVVRVDVNPAQYDISTLRVLNTSHACDIRVTGNKIEFIMATATLAVGDHGNILFKMKSRSDLEEGNMVKKKASIYFDYNFPIVTNDANTTFQALSTGNWVKDESVKLYPNPTAGMVKIEASSAINSVELYDIQGRLLEVQKSGEMNISFDVMARAKGMYFVKVITEKGTMVEKLIKE